MAFNEARNSASLSVEVTLGNSNSARNSSGAEKGSERFVPVFRCLWHLGVGAAQQSSRKS